MQNNWERYSFLIYTTQKFIHFEPNKPFGSLKGKWIGHDMVVAARKRKLHGLFG